MLYGGTEALNRAMTAFCAPDPRLKAVGYLPLNDPARALQVARSRRSRPASPRCGSPPTRPATSRPPTSTSIPSGPAWPRPGCPSCSTSGAGSSCPRRSTTTAGPARRTGSAAARTCGPRTSRSCTTRRSASSPAWRSTGSSSAFPALRGAAIELGATWVPGLLRNVDHALRSFSKFEPALRELNLLPSEYLRRQVRFTPFPFEDTAWLLEQCGPELFMFSTDYPHPEGGKRPFEAFGDAVAGFDESTRERFFWRNGAELLGLA